MIINFSNAKPSRPAKAEISSAEFHYAAPARRSHAAEPIKNMEDIKKIQKYLIDNKQYRDNLIFIMGINFGLRCGDLLNMRVGSLIDTNGFYRDQIVIQEGKTQKFRTVYPNEAVEDAADLYFMNAGTVDFDDYLFRSESNRGKNSGEHLAVRNVERMLKNVINDELGMDVHASTHCLRKTFAYHVIMTAPNRDRALEFLMKIFGHSNIAVTLRYAGITDMEIKNAYQNLNLGGHDDFFDWTTATGLNHDAV